MTPRMYTAAPRVLTPAENAAITAQCILLTYADDVTPQRTVEASK